MKIQDVIGESIATIYAFGSIDGQPPIGVEVPAQAIAELIPLAQNDFEKGTQDALAYMNDHQFESPVSDVLYTLFVMSDDAGSYPQDFTKLNVLLTGGKTFAHNEDNGSCFALAGNMQVAQKYFRHAYTDGWGKDEYDELVNGPQPNGPQRNGPM